MKSTPDFYLLPHAWTGSETAKLEDIYKKAFAEATELYLVNAFLTEWRSDLKQNAGCTDFKLVIGSDFGTTRIAAVKDARKWARRKRDIRAFNKRHVNFHPKAVLWRAKDGAARILVGSSNLTRAAFESNVEANVCLVLTEDQYRQAKEGDADKNLDWLNRYSKAPAVLDGAERAQ